MKDLICGASDKYEWDKIKNWILSIEQSGFEGDVILLTYRMDDATIRKCLEHPKITLIGCQHDAAGNLINHNVRGRDTQAHQMRFFHLWQYLKEQNEYRYVIMTDTRDVVFQYNPSEWLDKLPGGQYSIIAASEGLNYEDEMWGKENLLCGFGPYIYEDMKHTKINNVGTIAVQGNIAANFAITLFMLGEGKYIPNDQSGFNFLVRHPVFIDGAKLLLTTETAGWAMQLGTFDDPTKPFLWEKLKEARPTLKDDGVYNSLGLKFAIVHQYDRNPAYNEYFNSKFKE